MKIDARDIFHTFIEYMYMQVLLVTEFLQPSFALLMKGRKKRAGGVEEGISDRAYSKFSSNVTCQCRPQRKLPQGTTAHRCFHGGNSLIDVHVNS